MKPKWKMERVGETHVLKEIDGSGMRPASDAEVWAFSLIAQIQDALNTEETGDVLVEIACEAHQAELATRDHYQDPYGKGVS